MFAELVANTNIVIYPVIGLLIFFSFMTGVYAWAFWPSRKAEYERIAASVIDEKRLHGSSQAIGEKTDK